MILCHWVETEMQGLTKRPPSHLLKLPHPVKGDNPASPHSSALQPVMVCGHHERGTLVLIGCG